MFHDDDDGDPSMFPDLFSPFFCHSFSDSEVDDTYMYICCNVFPRSNTHILFFFLAAWHHRDETSLQSNGTESMEATEKPSEKPSEV